MREQAYDSEDLLQAWLAKYPNPLAGGEQMCEVFAATDTMPPSLERARLGARGSLFARPKGRGLYDPLMAEAWPVTLNPGRFPLRWGPDVDAGTDRWHLRRPGGGGPPRTRR
jgi:hypothetical protein